MMPEDTHGEAKFELDDDWKQEAQREKERLAQETAGPGQTDQLPPASLEEILNILVMQAVAGLGGMQMPDGRVLPPNLDLAKHHIDLLALLEEKTRGNLTEDEDRVLKGVLHELRMRYLEITTQGGPGASPGSAKPNDPPAG